MGAGGERIKTDMDYDEMISALEGYFEGKDLKHGDALKIADGIKTMMAERDALIEQVHGRCLFCANRIKCLCENDIEFRSYCRLNNDCNWRWRGPQKV